MHRLLMTISRNLRKRERKLQVDLAAPASFSRFFAALLAAFRSRSCLPQNCLAGRSRRAFGGEAVGEEICATPAWHCSCAGCFVRQQPGQGSAVGHLVRAAVAPIRLAPESICCQDTASTHTARAPVPLLLEPCVSVAEEMRRQWQIAEAPRKARQSCARQ